MKQSKTKNLIWLNGLFSENDKHIERLPVSAANMRAAQKRKLLLSNYGRSALIARFASLYRFGQRRASSLFWSENLRPVSPFLAKNGCTFATQTGAWQS